MPRGFCTRYPVQAAPTGTSSPSKTACAHAPGGPRSRSPKLLLNPRSSGNDQANCFEEDFVPAAQLATQTLRINCKPSKTPGKPKINTVKEEHFPLESDGQGKTVSSGLAPRRQLRFIYCATRINVSLWLCCSLVLPSNLGEKGPVIQAQRHSSGWKAAPGQTRCSPASPAPHRALSHGPGTTLRCAQGRMQPRESRNSARWRCISLGAEPLPQQQTACRVGNGSS